MVERVASSYVSVGRRVCVDAFGNLDQPMTAESEASFKQQRGPCVAGTNWLARAKKAEFFLAGRQAGKQLAARVVVWDEEFFSVKDRLACRVAVVAVV